MLVLFGSLTIRDDTDWIFQLFCYSFYVCWWNVALEIFCITLFQTLIIFPMKLIFGEYGTWPDWILRHLFSAWGTAFVIELSILLSLLIDSSPFRDLALYILWKSLNLLNVCYFFSCLFNNLLYFLTTFGWSQISLLVVLWWIVKGFPHVIAW